LVSANVGFETITPGRFEREIDVITASEHDWRLNEIFVIEIQMAYTKVVFIISLFHQSGLKLAKQKWLAIPGAFPETDDLLIRF